MPRTTSGWLKADALQTAGVKEEYAIKIGNTTYSAELWWHNVRKQYVVNHKEQVDGSWTVFQEWRFDPASLTPARKQFALVMGEIKKRNPA